jgi:hypothetical protein
MEDVGLLIFAILRTPYWVFVVLTFLYIKLRNYEQSKVDKDALASTSLLIATLATLTSLARAVEPDPAPCAFGWGDSVMYGWPFAWQCRAGPWGAEVALVGSLLVWWAIAISLLWAARCFRDDEETRPIVRAGAVPLTITALILLPLLFLAVMPPEMSPFWP